MDSRDLDYASLLWLWMILMEGGKIQQEIVGGPRP
jgi:hypothetical protein